MFCSLLVAPLDESKAVEEFIGAGPVAQYLPAQRLCCLELSLRPEPGQEDDLDSPGTRALERIEQMRLDRRISAAEGGPHAYVRHGTPATAVVQVPGPRDVDARGGLDVGLRLEVQRRNGLFRSDPAAGNDLSAEAERPPEKSPRLADPP